MGYIDKLIEERYQTKNKEDSSDDKEIEKIKRENDIKKWRDYNNLYFIILL